MPETVLIVEDEQDLARTLEYNLQHEGYATRVAHTGRAALEIVAGKPRPDLVVLDIMLPDLPGTEVCKKIRAGEHSRDLPVVMLTAKGEEIDRVVGLELGADDYVVKPFSVRELMLRVRAVLRRHLPAPESLGELAFGCLRVDPEAHRAWVDGRELVLTALEFRLLVALLSRRGRVQTRDVLLSDVWGMDGDVSTRTVDTHVKRLRQKLGPAGEYIETLRGVGYSFRSEPDDRRR